MMRLLKLIPFVLIFGISIAASGYEVETHEEMSEHAARHSVLTQGVLSDIGLTGTLDTVVLSDGSIDGTIPEWIRYGARHEDDHYYINHFYNPLNGQGYSFLIISGFPSPVWGIEETDIAEQEYSLRDARDNFYRGLILPGTADRARNLALTFRALGQVMHLIQDAAQPQHTRNDSHIMGSLYELFTNESRGGLHYDGYPSDTTLVKFNTALSLWHTLPPQINILAGQGVAEYSNRSFISTGTNFRPDGSNVITDPNFPSPAYANTGYDTTIDEMLQTMPTCSVITNLHGTLTFYKNTITDKYTNSPDDLNLYTTTLSIFDADLQNEYGERFFSLNRFNFCAAQDRLIPRAVGYSGGIIDYFFRGKLEANYTATSDQMTVTVKNISGPENTIHDGTFELYYDANDTDSTRKSLAIINGANVGSAGIVDGGSWVITANSPSDVDTSKPNPYILVFRGIVGTEEAVMGKVLQAAIRLYAGGKYGLYKFTKDGVLIFGPIGYGGLDYIIYGIAIDLEYLYIAGEFGLYKYRKDGTSVFGPLNYIEGLYAIAID